MLVCVYLAGMLVNLGMFWVFFVQGEYFFVLDQMSVLPGYPKLIKDVWGINGPIDAAFTRFNCQGKTYIFKVGIHESILTHTGLLSTSVN